MAEGKTLTISVAAYNVELFLAEALESCIVPSAEKLEVIIVNDGSTDDTLEVAHEFEKRCPSVFKTVDKPNGGYGTTINAALRGATGKYFRYLDGDDWFDQDELEKYIALLRQCDEDAVFTPYYRVYEDGGPAEMWDDLSGFAEGRYDLNGLGSASRIAACALAYRTDLLRETGFQMSEHCFYTDVEYACLPFVFVESVRVSKLAPYRYRIGREGQSVSPTEIERHYKDIIHVCTRLLRELDEQTLAKSDYLRRSAARECVAPFNFITKIPASKERKEDIMAFDALLKDHGILYEEVARLSKRARLLRASGFSAYALLCWASVWGQRWVR